VSSTRPTLQWGTEKKFNSNLSPVNFFCSLNLGCFFFQFYIYNHYFQMQMFYTDFFEQLWKIIEKYQKMRKNIEFFTKHFSIQLFRIIFHTSFPTVSPECINFSPQVWSRLQSKGSIFSVKGLYSISNWQSYHHHY
jgi:hypothetical protein